MNAQRYTRRFLLIEERLAQSRNLLIEERLAQSRNLLIEERLAQSRNLLIEERLAQSRNLQAIKSKPPIQTECSEPVASTPRPFNPRP
jgi:hypothetical protein